MTTNKYTAKITGRGVDSTVPDNADAVDADIYCAGELVGAVTLLPDLNNELSTWGELGHWADDMLFEHLDRADDSSAAIDAIVEAVRAADGA